MCRCAGEFLRNSPQTDNTVFLSMRIAWTWTGCRLLLLRVVFVFRPLPLEWERCHRNLGAIKSSTRKACGPGPAGGGLPDEMANSPFSCLTFLLVCTLVWNWCTLAIDSLTTPVLKCIWLLRFLPFCFGFPSRCLMVWWFVGPGPLRFCAQLLLQMRIASGWQASSVAGCVHFSPFALGRETMSMTPWNRQTQHQEGLRILTCWRWAS